MNTPTPKDTQEGIPAPEEETLVLREEIRRFESDEILKTKNEVILKSIQRGGKWLPSIFVLFIFITTAGVIWALVTWLWHMLLGENLWWLSKNRVMQIHAYISGVLNGSSSLGLILLLRYYFHSRHNSN